VEAHVNVEKISAVTLKVSSMPTSVRFYRDLLSLEIVYGSEDAYFSSLRTKAGRDPILNLDGAILLPSGGGSSSTFLMLIGSGHT
jgi:catechol 2,3-dioxygenase-like lactoylglutathione lyase family enzyme